MLESEQTLNAAATAEHSDDPAHSDRLSPDAEMPATSNMTPAAAALWKRFAADRGNPDVLDDLVRMYQPLVRSELRRARSRFPSHIDAEELEAAGLEALFLSIRDFNPALGCSFEGYSKKRIWGSMVDRVRRMDGIPRTALRAAKTLNAASANFRQKHGRNPDMDELAAEAGVSPQQLGKLERQAQISNKLSLDVSRNGANESGAELAAVSHLPGREDNPLLNMANSEMRALLVEGLKALPDRERSILVLYYTEGIMFTEIAAAMEVSESRVSQMHSRALERLKRYLTCPAAREAADDRLNAEQD